MGKIIVCGLDEIADKAKVIEPAAVLSIQNPGKTAAERGAPPKLADGLAHKILTFWDSEQPVVDGPDIEQIEQGIAFVMENIAKGDVIVHCHAGKSRSTAIALGALAQLYPRKDEAELVDMLLQIRPGSSPNIIIVGMADQLAGRSGKLLKAVENHPGITADRASSEENRRRERLQCEPLIPKHKMGPKPRMG